MSSDNGRVTRPRYGRRRMKTSSSDPLRIAELPIGEAGGRIGISLCPGKQAAGLDGTWARDLQMDLEVVARRFGAQVVVSLVEHDEFERLGVAGLGEAVRAQGMQWHHLPIVDGSVPDAVWESRWSVIGRELRARLCAGGRVFVHCRGGLGRAGMVAARLIAELGVPPAEAMVRVRAARPGAIENAAQEAWVLLQGAVEIGEEVRTSRELAVLAGGALGDALGYRVEFDALAAIRARYGEEGIRLETTSGPLVVSDDTQMTLFTLEGMTRGWALGGSQDSAVLVEAIREAYLDWYGTQDSTVTRRRVPVGSLARRAELSVRRAPGNTCLAALRAGGVGQPERPINDSKGCGGVMRVAPLAFLPAEAVSDAALMRLAIEAAALTHGHVDGFVPAGAMAVMVRSLLGGANWGEAIMATLAALEGIEGRNGTLRAINGALTWARDELQPIGTLGEGWVGEEAFGIGLAAAMRAESFNEALALAANHDGDSDSTASIAGQLYAARHGMEALPVEAIERIDVMAAIVDVAEGWWQAVREVG